MYMYTDKENRKKCQQNPQDENVIENAEEFIRAEKAEFYVVKGGKPYIILIRESPKFRKSRVHMYTKEMV